MSDMRAIVAIGSSITAVVMIMGLFTLLPTVQTATAESFLVGHATVKITDGETGLLKAYRQSDNAPLDQMKNCVMDGLFGTALEPVNINGGACGIITHVAIGDNGAFPLAITDDIAAMSNEYVGVGPTNRCAAVTVAEAGFGTPTAAAVPASANDPAAVTLRCDQANFNAFTVTVSDVNGSADPTCIDPQGDGIDECDLTEVAIFDGSGIGATMYARSGFTPTTVTAGDIVEMDYQTTVT